MIEVGVDVLDTMVMVIEHGERFWFRPRTEDGRRTTWKTMVVALARKLLIMLRRASRRPARWRRGSACRRRSEETEPARELNRFGARAAGGRNCR